MAQTAGPTAIVCITICRSKTPHLPPSSVSKCSGIMRTKTGNGQKVDLERVLEDLKVVVRDGEALLKSGFGDLKQRAVTGIKTTDEALRSHPYQLLGIMFGV